MKFDYCLGNPPYQETKGGTKNVDIWPDFVKGTSNIAKIRCLVHPGKWVVPKKYMKNVQTQLLEEGLANFNYYPNSSDVFNNVSIDGGVSITYFNKEHKGKVMYSIEGQNKGIFNPDSKLFSSNFEEEAYNKVFNKIDTTLNMLPYKFGVMTFSDGQYGFNKSIHGNKVSETSDNMKEPIKVWASITFGKGTSVFKWYYIEKADLIDPPEKLFSSRKVMLDMKGHAIAHGKGNVINNLPQICDKDVIGDKVYWFFPKNDTDRELQLIKSLFMTKTARYLMCITQKSLCVDGFENIPDYLELAKLLPEDELFTDEWFYKTFDFSKELINEIETRVSPKVEK